jgi:hypothetical protein
MTAIEARDLASRLAALLVRARAFIPADRPDATTRQWLGRVRDHGADPQWDRARELAIDLALMTPSMLGATAFDRLTRSMKDQPAADQATAEVLRRARPRLLRVDRRGTRDLERDVPVTAQLDPNLGDGVLFARFAAIADGTLIPAGPVLMLEEDGLAVALSFVRPGRVGFTNSVRCAEAVYRHMVRHGAFAGTVEDPFDPEHDAVDRLAAAWAALGREPTEAEQAEARPLTGPGALIDTLVSVVLARDLRRDGLAAAYRRIAAIMMETIARRAANGSARVSLDAIAQELNGRIARGDMPPETRGLFDTLRAQIPRGGGTTRGDADLDKLVQRIQALRAKTVEQGCTEQEALAAAEKVAELLDRYGLSLSELDLRKQACEGIGVETGRKRRGPIDDCMTTIAAFFDCRVWLETADDDTLRYIFFGMPADVQAAVYLHDLVALAFASETGTFQAGPIYGATPSGARRNATTSFQVGLARGINGKLDVLRRSRHASPTAGAGRALVPVKESLIDDEMERLGLHFRRLSTRRRMVQREAYGAGQEAGQRFEYTPGLEAGRT